MSDPRNVAHAKKVTQEKKHHGTAAIADDMPAAQPGKKRAAAKEKHGSVDDDPASGDAAGAGMAVESDTSAAPPPASLEGSLSVLAKLKEMEFYSRANLEQLAVLSFTVEDELKQKELVGPLAEVLSAQNTFQTRLTALLNEYKLECDRLQGSGA